MTILCEPDEAAGSVLAAALEGGVRLVASVPAAAEALAADPRETLVVLGAGVPLDQALAFTTELRARTGSAAVILLRSSLDLSVVALAVGTGVRDVVLADGAALAEACRRFRAAAPAPAGRVITVFAAKGGCGKTTLATNLAAALSGAGQSVCLVDLDLAFGDVASSLRLEPGPSLIDAVTAQGTLVPAAVPSLLTPFRPGLDCILAPVRPGQAEKVPATAVGELLTVLSGLYDHTVVDTPGQLSANVLAALDASHHHVLLTTPEVPALKNLRLTLDMLDMLSYDPQARSIVFNRSDSQVGLVAADIERVVKSQIAAYVPSSRDVPASINRGVPLVVAQPDHPVSRAVRRFAVARLAAPQSPAAPRRVRRPGVRPRRWP